MFGSGKKAKLMPEKEEISDQEVLQEDMHQNMEITIERPDGTEERYEVIGIFATEDDRLYMAMHSLDNSDESNVSLFPYIEGDDGLVKFVDFESDEEYQRAVDTFLEYFVHDEEGFTEVDLEDESE